VVSGRAAFARPGAEMLGMKRGQFFDLLYEHRVSPVQMDIEDLERDFGVANNPGTAILRA